MKISKRRIAGGIREVVKAVQYVTALFLVIITASLLPGDSVDISAAAWVVGLVLFTLADAAVSLPLLMVAKRLERDSLEPVPVRSDW